MKKEDIKIFEAIFLDGDKIEDCDRDKFSIRGVMDVVDFFQDKQKSEIKNIIKNSGNECWGTKSFNQGYQQAKLDILKELNK